MIAFLLLHAFSLGEAVDPAPSAPSVTVAWPPERLPRKLVVNGVVRRWKRGERFHFEGPVRFGPECPVRKLEGLVELRGETGGWRLLWTLPKSRWTAAATSGELGEAAPFEAKRALAAVLLRWIEGGRDTSHPDGTLCPLTHCAVIRGVPSRDTETAVERAPRIALDPAEAFYTGSKGGVSFSPREVWGRGSTGPGGAAQVPGDRWATWERRLAPAQVRALKGALRPGLREGQRGMFLGRSGPFPVEDLRLEAGRRWGWNLWPSNACEGVLMPDGSLRLRGRGWGHNTGLCLATALHRGKEGWKAEAILAEAFGARVPVPEQGPAQAGPR
jgi:hypothetical protein